MMILFTAAILGLKFSILSASVLPAAGSECGERSMDVARFDSNLTTGKLQQADPDSNDAAMIFREVEAGISMADVGRFSRYFGKQTYLSVKNANGAYYSSNQARYVVNDYFVGKRIVSFKLSALRPEERFPYATGGGIVRHKGTNEIFQVYVSLVRTDGRWVIARFNMY